jgi:hypothetical protein
VAATPPHLLRFVRRPDFLGTGQLLVLARIAAAYLSPLWTAYTAPDVTGGRNGTICFKNRLKTVTHDACYA